MDVLPPTVRGLAVLCCVCSISVISSVQSLFEQRHHMDWATLPRQLNALQKQIRSRPPILFTRELVGSWFSGQTNERNTVKQTDKIHSHTNKHDTNKRTNVIHKRMNKHNTYNQANNIPHANKPTDKQVNMTLTILTREKTTAPPYLQIEVIAQHSTTQHRISYNIYNITNHTATCYLP
jgi:hypothetical protein